MPSYARGHLTYLHFQIARLVANTSKQFIDIKSFYAISASFVCCFIYYYTSCQHVVEKSLFAGFKKCDNLCAVNRFRQISKM